MACHPLTDCHKICTHKFGVGQGGKPTFENFLSTPKKFGGENPKH